MPNLTTTPLPTLTAPVTFEIFDPVPAPSGFVTASLLGTVLQAFPPGSPVSIDVGPSDAVVESASLLPGAELRMRFKGPFPAGLITLRVTIFPTLQVE